MIFGIYGATRADELTRVDVADVTQQQNVFVINILHTKTNVTRTFTVENEFAEYIIKYRNLRPSKLSTTRFFINYQKGKCTNQPIGKNKFLGTPKVIATYLNLKDPYLYTGHSFRRTSATLLADAGADLLTLKRHGGWRSDSAAQGYVQDSVNNKRKIGDLIAGQVKKRRTSTITSKSGADSAVTTSYEQADLMESNIDTTNRGNATDSMCTQSVVHIVHNESTQLVATVTGNSVQSTDIGIQPPIIPDEYKQMHFNNCSVNIHFHK